MSTQSHSPGSESRPHDQPASPIGEARAERDHWVHDFRNALGNTTIAASTVRGAIAERNYQEIDMLMKQIEEGCERCMRLLGTMPR